MSENEKKDKTFIEEIEIAGSELVQKVKELIQDANATRLIIRKPDGDVLIEVPIVAGAAVSGALTLFTPVLAAIGAIGALVAQVKIEIIRKKDDSPEQ